MSNFVSYYCIRIYHKHVNCIILYKEQEKQSCTWYIHLFYPDVKLDTLSLFLFLFFYYTMSVFHINLLPKIFTAVFLQTNPYLTKRIERIKAIKSCRSGLISIKDNIFFFILHWHIFAYTRLFLICCREHRIVSSVSIGFVYSNQHPKWKDYWPWRFCIKWKCVFQSIQSCNSERFNCKYTIKSENICSVRKWNPQCLYIFNLHQW